jgi:hypothetical protein
MATLSITLVDHTADSSDSLKNLIKSAIADIFQDLISQPSQAGTVNVKWMSQSPAAGDQNLVLHFVQDVASSYVSQKMAGKAHRVDGGGFTRVDGGRTGSEFYKLPLMGDKPTHLTAKGYAKLAAHEGMHNITGMNNSDLHGRGGLASSPPQLPVTDDNKAIVQAALSKIPAQLL